MREHQALSTTVTPKFGPISVWTAICGMSRSGTYEAPGDGRLRAVKLDSKTLVDFEHELAYLASLPAAEITTGGRNRRRRLTAPVGSASKADAAPSAEELARWDEILGQYAYRNVDREPANLHLSMRRRA
jgi:hypothetical protein